MNPFERLREIAAAFRQGGQEERGWFDASNPVCARGEKLLKSGQAEEAERVFAGVLSEGRYRAVVKRQQPRILLALATAQMKQGKLEEAERNAAAARVLLNGAREGAGGEYSECCQLQGEIARGLGEDERAVEHFRESVEAVKAQRQPDWREGVRRMAGLARVLRELGKSEEAESTAREAVERAEERCRGEREEGDALIEWAQALAACGRFEEARAAGDRGVEKHRAACGNEAAEVAQDYEKLASICQQQEDYQAAVGYLERALQARERQIGGDTSQLALLLMTLADIYTLLGRLAPALELMQQAVGKLGPSRDGNLAGALEKLGSMYVRTGRYVDAADCYRRAREYWVSEPEAYALQLAANTEALESLAEWLPEEGADVVEGGEVDTGIAVLLPERRQGGAAGVGAGGAPGLAAMGVAIGAGGRGREGGGVGAAPAAGGVVERDRNGLCGWEDLALEEWRRE